jgi:chromosome segregation ATPase
MATTEAIGEGLTFEKVWAAIQATNAQMKDTDERMKETDERMKETDKRMKETDKRMKETDKRMKETDALIKANGEQLKETGRQMGYLSNRFGEVVEHMVVPKLAEKFKELGFEFEKIHRNTLIKDPKHGFFTELDAFLENGDKAMVVEIKSKPNIEDINDHVERMEKLRLHVNRHGDTRKYLGAIAGAIFGDSEKNYALKQGFYVIEPSGDSFNIIEPKGDYHPHEW